MNTILITTSTFNTQNLDILRQNGLNVYCNTYGRTLSEDQVYDLIAETQPIGLIAGLEPLTARVMSAGDNLRVISRNGVGLDNIDLNEARKRGIAVVNTPNAPVQAVSELTIAVMLSALRKIHEADQNVRDGSWTKPMGRLLGEQTIGIIGCGRIGTNVADLAGAFGARTVGYDLFIENHSQIEMLGLDEVLRISDIVSLHIPYDKTTHHFLDAKRIYAMKKGSILCNISRGGLVDESALFDALNSDHLAGACLDTFEEEPYRGPLVNLSQVILTPHIGSYAMEARIKMEREAIDNLMLALDTQREFIR